MLMHGDIVPNLFLSSQLKAMSLQVGYPNLFIDDVYLRDYYQLLSVQKNDLYRNVIAGSKFNQRVRQRDLINEPLELAWRDRLSQTQISYVHQVNKVGQYGPRFSLFLKVISVNPCLFLDHLASFDRCLNAVNM